MQIPHSAVIRSDSASARLRMSCGRLAADFGALVAREPRLVGARDRERAADVVDARACGTVPTTSPRVRIAHVERPRARDALAGDAHRFRRRLRLDGVGRWRGGQHAKRDIMQASCKVIEAEVERVEIAPAARGKVRCRTVGDQRNALLGDAAVRAQRRVESGQVVTGPARADDGQPLGYDHEIADAVLAAARSARRRRPAAARRRCPATRRSGRGRHRRRRHDSRRRSRTSRARRGGRRTGR